MPPRASTHHLQHHGEIIIKKYDPCRGVFKLNKKLAAVNSIAEVIVLRCTCGHYIDESTLSGAHLRQKEGKSENTKRAHESVACRNSINQKK